MVNLLLKPKSLFKVTHLGAAGVLCSQRLSDPLPCSALSRWELLSPWPLSISLVHLEAMVRPEALILPVAELPTVPASLLRAPHCELPGPVRTSPLWDSSAISHPCNALLQPKRWQWNVLIANH